MDSVKMMLEGDINKTSGFFPSLSPLSELCISAVCSSDVWRFQRRTLKRLPYHLANRLFASLLRSHQIFPPFLELFQECVQDLDLAGVLAVDTTWMSYISAFRHLSSLSVEGCRSINNKSLSHLSGLTSLSVLRLSQCVHVGDEGVERVVRLATGLVDLRLSETRVSSAGASLLGSLTLLTRLDLGMRPVDDSAILALKKCTSLQYLDLWGTRVSDETANFLSSGFPSLQRLSLSWTGVTRMPPIPSLLSLDLSNCSLASLFSSPLSSSPGSFPPALRELQLASTSFPGASAATWRDLGRPWLHSLLRLDASRSPVTDLGFLSQSPDLRELLLASCPVSDEGLLALFSEDERDESHNVSETLQSPDGGGLGEQAQGQGQQQTLAVAVNASSLLLAGSGPLPMEIDSGWVPIRGGGRGPGALRKLDLSGTRVGNLGVQAALLQLVSLEWLSLRATGVDDGALTEIALLTGLEDLDLGGTQVTGLLGEAPSLGMLASLPRLRSLDLRDAPLAADLECFEALRLLTSLTKLLLRGPPLADNFLSPLASLPSLASLNLENSMITPKGLRQLLRAPSLREVNARGSWFLTEANVEEFFERRSSERARTHGRASSPPSGDEEGVYQVVKKGKSSRKSTGGASGDARLFSPPKAFLGDTEWPLPGMPKGLIGWSKKPFRGHAAWNAAIDERRRYSREQLLKLRTLPVSLVKPQELATEGVDSRFFSKQ